MRRIVTIILTLLTSFSFAQTANPIFQGSKYYEFRNAVRIDSAFFAPRRDTVVTDLSLKAEGMLTYRPQDKSMWYYNGSYWNRLSSGSSFAIDSARRSHDTLYFRYTTGGELAVKMDYYTKAESDERYVLSPSGKITANFIPAWQTVVASDVPNITDPESKYLIVNAIAGDTAFTVIGGTGMADFTTNYAAVAHDKAGDHYQPLFVIRQSGSVYNTDRPIKNNLVADTIKFMHNSWNGQHLTDYGYYAYADHLYDHFKLTAQKDYKLYSFYPEDNPTIPFTSVNGAVQGGFIPSTTIPQVLSLTTATINYAQIATVHYLIQQGGVASRGAEWQVNLGKKSGYLETWVGVNRNLPGYARVLFYLDGVLQRVDTVRGAVQKLTYNYSNASTGKIQIVTGDTQNTSIRIGRTVWYQSDVSESIKTYLGGKILFVGDSWTQFRIMPGNVRMQSLTERFKVRYAIDGGDPEDIINVGRGGMTSVWGKYFFKSWLNTYKPKYVFIEFYINDANSSGSFGDPGVTTWNFNSTDPYAAGTDVDGKTNIAGWQENLKWMRDTAIANGVIPINMMNTPTGSITQTQGQSAWFSAFRPEKQYYDVETFFTSSVVADNSVNAPVVNAPKGNIDTTITKFLKGGTESVTGAFLVEAQEINSANSVGLGVFPKNNHTGSIGSMLKVWNNSARTTTIFDVRNNGSVIATDFSAGMTGFTIPPFTITSNAGIVRLSATNSTTLNYLYLADSFRNTIRVRIPLTLQNYNTAGLPSPPSADKGSLAYDSIKNRPAYYDGFFWNSLAREEDMFKRWDSINTKNNTILNQYNTTQTGNYAISGIGAMSRSVLVNADNASFRRYLMFSRDAVDTTKQLWAIGLAGVPGAGPGHAGSTLTFRSYDNTGAYLRDVVTIGRTGDIGTSGSIEIGANMFAGGSLSAGGSASIASSLSHGGAFAQQSVQTVTTDYTVLDTDLYINVNNTGSCTITIPALTVKRMLYIKKVSNNTAPVDIVVAGGTKTIDGGSTIVVSKYNDAVILHDDGTNWFTYAKPYAQTGGPFVSAGTPVFTPNGTTEEMLGTGYTVDITGSGNFFRVVITTGTGVTNTGTIGTIVYNTPFPDVPVSVYSATDLNAVGTTVCFSATNTTSILMANKTTLAPSTVYTFSVHTGLIQ